MQKTIDYESFMQLYVTRLSDYKIAKQMGFSSISIYIFRHKLGLPTNNPRKTARHTLEEDYARILKGEDLSNITSSNAECIVAYREIEGKDMVIRDKIKKTGLRLHTIKLLTKAYQCHHER